MFWFGFAAGLVAGAILGVMFACFAFADDYDDELGR